MDNDKNFAVYTLTLVTALAAVLAFVITAGVGQIPAPVAFVEHLALGLLFRGAYKSFGGFDVSDWIPSFRTAPALVPAMAGASSALASDDAQDDDERLAA